MGSQRYYCMKESNGIRKHRFLMCDVDSFITAHPGSWITSSSDAHFLAPSVTIILLFCNIIHYRSKLHANEQHHSFSFCLYAGQNDSNCFLCLHVRWEFLMLLKNKTFTHLSVEKSNSHVVKGSGHTAAC